MASIKLNSKRHEPRKFKIRRKNTINKAVNSDNSLLQPATDLSSFGKSLFKSIKKNYPTLQNSDNYLINLLCSEYDLFIKMNNYVIKHGPVDKTTGKKCAQVQLEKVAVDQIIKLSAQLNITPKNRINADYHQQDKHDPLKVAIR